MSVLSGLTFLPVAPWPVLLLLAGLAGALVWWPAGTRERTETMTARGRRSAMVLLLLVAALRPALPGTDVRVDASAIDVYFVVDTTSSVMARDYADGRPRLDGVRADLKGISTQLSGARFSLITFDIDPAVRLPLTSDEQALSAAADTLRAETTVWSRGSSVTLARDLLKTSLQRGQASHPERARLVFYLGDGEQTSRQAPEPFQVDGQLVNGGAVLGYGTSAGGRMSNTGVRDQGDIVDPSTKEPALSVIDEKELGAIAQQLGVPYLHRTANDGGTAIVDTVQLKELSTLRQTEGGDAIGGRTELGWVALLLLAVLAAWELGGALAAATSVGRAGGRRSAAAPRPPRMRRLTLRPDRSTTGSPPAGDRTRDGARDRARRPNETTSAGGRR